MEEEEEEDEDEEDEDEEEEEDEEKAEEEEECHSPDEGLCTTRVVTPPAPEALHGGQARERERLRASAHTITVPGHARMPCKHIARTIQYSTVHYASNMHILLRILTMCCQWQWSRSTGTVST